jgi:hypothetical protein
LTLNCNKVLTNEKLINIFHHNFNFEKVKEYSIEEILTGLSLTFSEENVKDFYKLSLEFYLGVSLSFIAFVLRILLFALIFGFFTSFC